MTTSTDDEAIRATLRQRFSDLAVAIQTTLRNTPQLRSKTLAPKMGRLLAALDAVRNELAPKEAAKELGEKLLACPVCDRDPSRCQRGGQCAEHQNPLHRPEPWEFQTLCLARPDMEHIRDALKMLRSLPATRRGISDSALVCHMATVVLSHFYESRLDALRLPRHLQKLEEALGIRLAAFERFTDQVLYASPSLAEATKPARTKKARRPSAPPRKRHGPPS